MKVDNPKILQQLHSYKSVQAVPEAEEKVIRDVSIEGEEASGQELQRMEFYGCVLKESKYIHCDFSKSSFIDVVFYKCDLSNTDFKECYFMRCEFISCKGVGVDMQSSVMKHTKASDMNLRYANLNNIYLEHVIFDKTDMMEASMSEAKHKSWKASDTKFVGTNFFHTKLRGFDFTENELAGLLVSEDLSELKGIKISPVQALEIVKLLGINVAAPHTEIPQH